jgi:hypothetical protein
MTDPVETLADRAQNIEPCNAIFIGKEDVLPAIVARGHMVKRSCEFKS